MIKKIKEEPINIFCKNCQSYHLELIQILGKELWLKCLQCGMPQFVILKEWINDDNPSKLFSKDEVIKKMGIV